MESITEGLQKLEEVLGQVSSFLREMKDKERLATRLQSKILTLETRRSELEASLVKTEVEFLAAQKKKGEEIIAEAIKRAEAKTTSILSGAKVELDNLVSKNDGLKRAADLSNTAYLQKSGEIKASIKELENKRDALVKEIALSVQTRDGLEKQINSIKEKASAILG